MKNARLVRLVGAHLLAVIGEWAATVGVLVYAFEWGGARATGLASLAILAPPLVGAPVAAALTSSFRPRSVRRAGFAVQTAGYAAAAFAAAANAPAPVVVVATVIALTAIKTLRPTGAILLPSLVRTSRQLTEGNLWLSHCESASALIGPLAAAGLVAIGGAEAVFVACAIGGVISVGATLAPSDPSPGSSRAGRQALHPRHVIGTTTAALRQRPWAVGVIAISSAADLVIGAFDVMLVVIAFDSLDLGPSGAGLLNSLVGAGSFVSMFAAAMVVRRARLRPSLLASVTVAAGLCLLLAIWTDAPVAYVALPIIGVCLALIGTLARMLLQRSTDPGSLGPVFAFLELVSGTGQLVGSAVAQVLLAIGGIEVAFSGVAVTVGLVIALTARSIRKADDEAEVPVVEMALLRELPMFSPLPALALEAVARGSEYTEVAEGTRIITQGEPGDTFYAVADGEFDIVMSGEHIRTARRGEYFGEVALLAEVPRTASVVARRPGLLLAIHRNPFLLAVTGHDAAHHAALSGIRQLRFDIDLPPTRTIRPPAD